MLNLVMILHCHQPVGNFDHVFEMAVDRCYQPVLELLRDNPHVQVGMHMSGPLFEWMESHQTATLDLLGSLIDRGQVEPLSGGFYEPLLATIPMRDARGQLEKMNEYLHARFGYHPTGFWLTERVWDPYLPQVLAGTGMVYTDVDDTHFYYAGLKPDDIYGPYITEKEGSPLRLVATPMIMRYLIPFKPVEEVMAHLKDLDRAGKNGVVYGDDCEKFGLWPGTYDWVIKKGWLKRCFEAIGENASWLRTRLPGAFVRETPVLGRIYLPQASYEEMTEWALPSDRSEILEDMIASLKQDGRWNAWHPFVRGGVWDNFLVKYDEANRMHKKMLYLSENLSHDPEGRTFLWRGQCNCAYWHGVFGGLYLGHLRRAVHQNLLRAHESMARKSGKAIELRRVDMDKDGEEDVLISTPTLSMGLSPAKGGSIFEVGHIPLALNLSDVLTRRREAYHRRVHDLKRKPEKPQEGTVSIHDMLSAKDEGLEKLLTYDRYSKTSFLDHFLPLDCTMEQYASNDYRELGDFVQGRYVVHEASVNRGEAIVILSHKGHTGSAEVNILKELRVARQGEVYLGWDIACSGTRPISCVYGSEWNLTLFSDLDPERYYRVNGARRREVSEKGLEEGVTEFSLVNGPDHLTTVFSFSRPVSVWFFPLMSVSMSEEGVECTYQGSSFLFLHPLQLSEGKTSRFECRLRLTTE